MISEDPNLLPILLATLCHSCWICSNVRLVGIRLPFFMQDPGILPYVILTPLESPGCFGMQDGDNGEKRGILLVLRGVVLSSMKEFVSENSLAL